MLLGDQEIFFQICHLESADSQRIYDMRSECDFRRTHRCYPAVWLLSRASVSRSRRKCTSIYWHFFVFVLAWKRKSKNIMRKASSHKRRERKDFRTYKTQYVFHSPAREKEKLLNKRLRWKWRGNVSVRILSWGCKLNECRRLRIFITTSFFRNFPGQIFESEVTYTVINSNSVKDTWDKVAICENTSRGSQKSLVKIVQSNHYVKRNIK